MAEEFTAGGVRYDPVAGTPLDRAGAANVETRLREGAGAAVQAVAEVRAAREELGSRVSALEAMGPSAPEGPADGQTASLILQGGTSTRAALEANFPSRGEIDGKFTEAAADEVITGDWTVSKGQTTNEDPPRFGLERKFVQGVDGALYDADTRLEMRISRQQSTTQTPPGYSMAEIALIDTNATNDPSMHGEINTIKMISNRTLFSQRLEVNMGGDGRATLRSGTSPRDVYLRLMMHNPNHPELRIYGATHPDSNAGMAHIIEGRLRVTYSTPGTTTALQLEGKSTSGSAQDVRVNQYGDGTQGIEFRLGGTMTASVSAHASNNALRLQGQGGVEVVGGDMTFSPSQGPVLRSPDGSHFRLVVGNNGAVTGVKL